MSMFSCCAAIMKATMGSEPSGTYSASPFERITFDELNTVS